MDKKEETIVEHLIEFRKRFLISLVFFLLTFLLAFIYAGNVYKILTSQFHHKLLVLGPNDILWIYMMLSSVIALTISLPFLTYQVWAYVRPALEKREAKALLAYIPAIFICFLLGLLFGFFIVTPALLSVLLQLGDNLFETQLTAQNYISFVFHTTLPIAVVFEFPVIMAFLTSLGLVHSNFLTTYRRYAYFVLIILAVVLTPADFISDLTLSIPLVLIYEIGIVLSKYIEKRRRRKSGTS